MSQGCLAFQHVQLINNDRTVKEMGLEVLRMKTLSEKPGYFSTPQILHEELEGSERYNCSMKDMIL